MTRSAPALLCSDADLAAGDDQRGTAATFTSFLVIEQRGSFGREAAQGALRALDPALAAAAEALPGLRPLAIRPVGRAESLGVRARFVGRTGPAAYLLETDGPPSAAELAALPATAPTQRDPLVAVCTNGSRDRCCAVKGRDLAAALHREIDGTEPGSDDAAVVEVSHLGGHRFAPTLLVLPTGYAYGRLDLAAALDVAFAAQDGLVHPLGIRGRADLTPAAQVADAHWRAAIGVPAPLADVRITRTVEDGPFQIVEATVRGIAERLRLRYESGPVVGATACDLS